MGPEIDEKTRKDQELRTRREARQKRILENAKDRLEKLNGRLKTESENGEVHTKAEIVPDPEVEQDMFPGTKSFTATERNYTMPSQQPRPFGNQENFPGADFNLDSDNIFQLFNQFSQLSSQVNGGGQQHNFTGEDQWHHTQQQETQQSQRQKPTRLANFLKSKLHLVIISIITYCLFITDNERFISYNVFFPLLLWEVAEVFMLGKPELPQSPLFNLIFIFAGIPVENSKAIIKILETLNKIFKDVGVFMFFFSLSHVAYLNLFQTE